MARSQISTSDLPSCRLLTPSHREQNSKGPHRSGSCCAGAYKIGKSQGDIIKVAVKLGRTLTEEGVATYKAEFPCGTVLIPLRLWPVGGSGVRRWWRRRRWRRGRLRLTFSSNVLHFY